MTDKAYFHLPGLFEFYDLYSVFLPLYREHREYFYDWCEIASVYGAPADSAALHIDRVFEPFYRMDARTAGGSGLGLYVVKLLCDRLGWSVKADLNDNVFTVSIFP